jgi:mannose-6-phosphate isomerase-like protein (cupin superfamily)
MRHVVNRSMAPHEWRGITIRDLTPADARWQGSLVEVDVPPRLQHPRARSTRCETFYYAVGGSVEFEVEGRDVTLNPGDLLVIEPNEWYSYRTGAGSARLLSFNVPPYDPGATEISEDLPAGTATRSDGG